MKTITNFRDLGGLTTQQSKTVRAKKLLRSGELSRISPEDQQQLLDTYRLEKIVDLRSLNEVSERPDILFEPTEYIHIDIFKSIHEEGAGLGDFVKLGSGEKARTYMHELYQVMTTNKVAQAGFTQVIETALSVAPENSFLFHCFAGKDRTGISAALLLETLGVPKELIYQDYLLTNKLRIQENQEVIQAAKDNGATQNVTEALEIALNVKSEYLDTFYQTIAEEFGDIQSYLTNALKISTRMQKDLQSLLLTD
ncbi:tyrosine-protein phosphatase [Enterococcus olivae]